MIFKAKYIFLKKKRKKNENKNPRFVLLPSSTSDIRIVNYLEWKMAKKRVRKNRRRKCEYYEI